MPISKLTTITAKQVNEFELIETFYKGFAVEIEACKSGISKYEYSVYLACDTTNAYIVKNIKTDSITEIKTDAKMWINGELSRHSIDELKAIINSVNTSFSCNIETVVKIHAAKPLNEVEVVFKEEKEKEPTEAAPIKRVRFSLPDNIDVKYQDSKYWAWMSEQGLDDSLKHNTIITRNEYLKSLGYNRQIHKLCEDDIYMLRHTLSAHFNHFYTKFHNIK